MTDPDWWTLHTNVCPGKMRVSFMERESGSVGRARATCCVVMGVTGGTAIIVDTHGTGAIGYGIPLALPCSCHVIDSPNSKNLEACPSFACDAERLAVPV